jgi:hypothetical protein
LASFDRIELSYATAYQSTYDVAAEFISEISRDNGQNWEPIESVYFGTGQWIFKHFHIDRPSSQTQFRFFAHNYFGELAAAISLDAVEITALSCRSPCPADMDGNGVLNTNDYQGFINRFAAQDPEGDMNHDGFYNILDFIEYQNAYRIGCPR